MSKKEGGHDPKDLPVQVQVLQEKTVSLGELREKKKALYIDLTNLSNDQLILMQKFLQEAEIRPVVTTNQGGTDGP